MEPEAPSGVWETVRAHPVITIFMLACTALGGALGLWLLPADWDAWRRLFLGLMGGVGSALIIAAPRMYRDAGW